MAARPLPVEMGKFGLLASHLRAVTDVSHPQTFVWVGFPSCGRAVFLQQENAWIARRWGCDPPGYGVTNAQLLHAEARNHPHCPVPPLGDAHGPSPLHQAQGLAGWGRSRPGAAVSTPMGAAGVAPAAVRLAGDSGAAVGAAGLVWGAPWGSCGGGFRYSAVLFDR